MTSAIKTSATTVAPASGLECRTDRATLVHALTTVGMGVTRRPVVPVLGGVLLDGHDGHLTVTTTDYETVVSVRVPEVVRSPGRLLIDYAEATKLLAALVRGTRKRDADAMPVTVRTTVDGGAVVELGGYTMPVTTYPAEEFPTLPEIPPTMAEVDRERFATDAARVLVAVGTDDTLPMLTGVQMQTAPGALTLAGTDRYRLAVAEVPATTAATEDRSVSFPGRVLSAVLKHCTGDRVRLGLDAAGDWVSLSCGALTVLTRPIEAPLPDYERLFPEVAVTARADRASLTQAAIRATAVVEAKKHTRDGRAAAQVAVTVDPAGSISVAPVLGEYADAVTAPDHPAEVDGATDTVRVLFTASYLCDAVNSLDGDTLALHLATVTRPVVFTAAHAPGYRHLVMPVRPSKS
ncbi:DNA polymerase III subunit beta [Saccharopolyspora rosea]|uniref:DNA polymerase III subunit beta n=1 Tax=Saccharopolyspora rosea TaxID=524884 RepID=UPI0021D8781D|nr:DNA polymerase III subunit beta [Saccharopolyspora rosea]